MILNQKGSTQLFLCLALLMALSGITITTIQKLQLLHNNRIRLTTLICMRKSHFHQSKFIKNINILNRPIQVAFYASKSAIPKITIPAKAVLKSLKLKQQFDLMKFYKEIYQIKECSKMTKGNIIIKSPYQLTSKTIFKREIDQTTILSKQSITQYYSSNNGISSFNKLPLIFKSTIKVDNKFNRQIKIKSERLGL